MIDFEPIDEETNIVDYPGYVGMTWDGELSISSEFKNFETFDWNTYSELIEELNESRYFDYQFRNLNNHVSFEAYQDIGFLVDEFLSVEVHSDDGSSYGGMASGRGYIFFLRAGFKSEDAIEEFNAVAIALNEDLKSISS
jgi:hypothetical protein